MPWMLSRRTLRWRLAPPLPRPLPPLPRPDIAATQPGPTKPQCCRGPRRPRYTRTSDRVESSKRAGGKRSQLSPPLHPLSFPFPRVLSLLLHPPRRPLADPVCRSPGTTQIPRARLRIPQLFASGSRPPRAPARRSVQANGKGLSGGGDREKSKWSPGAGRRREPQRWV